MADTTFVDETSTVPGTLIEASWLNDINDFYYTTFGGTSAGAITASTVRTAIDAQEDVITTRGDIIVGNATPAASRLAIGTDGKILVSNGTDLAYAYPKVVQYVEATPYTTYTTIAAGAGVGTIPIDNTIPQSGEGTELLTATITPKNASNRLVITCTFPVVATSVAAGVAISLLQDATANALAVTSLTTANAAYHYSMTLRHEMAAGTTSATTFKANIGINLGNLYINGTSVSRMFGGIAAARLVVEEWGV